MSKSTSNASSTSAGIVAPTYFDSTCQVESKDKFKARLGQKRPCFKGAGWGEGISLWKVINSWWFHPHERLKEACLPLPDHHLLQPQQTLKTEPVVPSSWTSSLQSVNNAFLLGQLGGKAAGANLNSTMGTHILPSRPACMDPRFVFWLLFLWQGGSLMWRGR